jgi:hypothetical protein
MQFSSKVRRRAAKKNTNAGAREIDVDNFAVLKSGKIAHYISPVGNYGTSRSGMTVVRFALFKMKGKESEVEAAKVMYANGRTSEGLPENVLPESVLCVIRGGTKCYLPGYDRKIRLWGISKGMNGNRRRVAHSKYIMSRMPKPGEESHLDYILRKKAVKKSHKTRRNPHSIDVAWTGKKADYVSPPGNYGGTGHSELAMHTGGAGKAVVRFALWKRPAKGYAGPSNAVQWAQVEYASGQILDGLPSEVLPEGVRNIIGYGSPRMPNRKQKLQLWALGKGVAANRGRKNPLTPEETRQVLHAAQRSAKMARKSSMDKYKFFLGRTSGLSMVADELGSGRAQKHARKMRHASATMTSSYIRHHKNVGREHAVWKAGNAAHKFMSKLDNLHLRVWREVPLAAVVYGGTAAKRAYAASVATVQERMKDLATALQEIANLRYYKTLLRTPLRAVAGAWGLMEVMRSDF